MTNPSSPTSELEKLLQEAKGFERARNFAAATTCFNNLVRQFPGNVSVYYEYGIYLNHIGQYEIAKNYLAYVLQRQPNHADAWLGLGVSLQELKSDIESEKCYRQALTLNPKMSVVYANLGILYRNKGQFGQAIQLYQQALALDPQLTDVYIALGNAYSMIGDNEKAIDCFKKGIALAPESPRAYNGLGIILELIHAYDEAKACFEKALALTPYFAEAQFNLGFYYLQHGDFERGLPLYEARWQMPTANPVRSQFIYPRWNGESLVGKTLLIFTEQGFGDVINFCRYIPLINKEGGKIYLNGIPEVIPLMQSFSYIDRIIIRGEDNPTADYYIPLQSLPLIFHTTLNTIPVNIPYIITDPDKSLYWRDFFSVQPAKLKIGICWRGRPNLLNAINRSCELKHFLPLLAIPDINFYVLQKEVSQEEKNILTDIILLGDKLNDFGDTAAIIEQLDLIITIDTSIAHLAGALNKPVWNLLPYSADWRWFLDRTDSPWYPSMRLYRQPTINDWQSVFNQVQQSLYDLIKVTM